MDKRQQVKDLIELAVDSTNDDDKERIAAAMKAVRMIRKYDMLESPLDNIANNEFVRAGRKFFDLFNDPAVKKVRNRVTQEVARRRR
jgi:hypothetical protein